MDKWDKLVIAIGVFLIGCVIVLGLSSCTPQGQSSPEDGKAGYYVIERREFPQDGNVCYTYRGVMDCLPLAEKGE